MKIFIPTEVKTREYRVGLLPSGAQELVEAGHEVFVQSGAAQGLGIEDGAYERVGATMTDKAQSGYEGAELVVKVKEPQAEELAWLQPGQLVFCYFHLAASRPLTEAMMKSGATAIAYETLRDERGHLPLLTPMSEIEPGSVVS